MTHANVCLFNKVAKIPDKTKCYKKVDMKFADALEKSVAMFSSSEFIKNRKEEDPKMVKHLQILQTINQHGFLTTNSQAGHKTVGKSVSDGKPYEMSERSYLTGFMLETDAIRFIKHLSIHTDKNVVHIPYCTGDLHVPSSLDIPLTIRKTKEGIDVVTHMATVLPFEWWELERKQVKLNKTEKIVFLFVWDTKWNRNASSASGLFTDVLKILKTL